MFYHFAEYRRPSGLGLGLGLGLRRLNIEGFGEIGHNRPWSKGKGAKPPEVEKMLTFARTKAGNLLMFCIFAKSLKWSQVLFVRNIGCCV